MADEQRDNDDVNVEVNDNNAGEGDTQSQETEDTQAQANDETERRFAGIEATLDKILGQISSLREAQGIMVENGAVVNDVETDIGHIEEDAFIPPKEMDLLI